MTVIVQLSAIDATMKTGLKQLNLSSKEQGFKIYAMCTRGPNTSAIEKDNIEVVNVAIDRKIGLSNLKSIFQIYKQLKKIKPDIVHVHTPVAAVLGRVAARLAKVPHVIYTAHGFYFHENMSKMKYLAYYSVEKISAKLLTDFLFTQSQEDANLAINNKFLPKDRILCIGNGVDVEGHFNPENIDKAELEYIYNEFGLSNKDIIITFIGRIVKEKGIFELLDAVLKIENPNIKLLVIGDLGQNERDVTTAKELIKYKNNKKIIFTGRRDDINKLLYISHIFCLPSYREGMPRSIIEAMAMNNAIIATNIRGSREEVIDGETGFLIPLYNSLIIKEKIEELIIDRDLLNSMKSASRRRALNLYNEQIVVKKQIKIFNDLTK